MKCAGMVGRFALGTSVVGSFVENGSPGEWVAEGLFPLKVVHLICKKVVAARKMCFKSIRGNIVGQEMHSRKYIPLIYNLIYNHE